ncbi:serine-rich adhesin for platelets [Aplysia californica]|uniref:Serine-rich adhesin for platelets n=1 Tax=Aplysia californica TaxID=6500 RepID=A0ABM1A8N3_APLCA|nr:serine-rich adhesin for platelets [Aplysia californica]
MQVYRDEEGDHSNRLFAAMADGTVAVFENITASCASYDLLYLPIGQSQVTCLQLLGNQLWCSCGNTVSIIHASTLDPMDRFTVSANPYDTVLSLVPGLPGVWLSVRGSSVLELWDPMSLSCKMLYDTRTGRYPNLRKEDDTYFNNARITSILALDHSVWVGTGEGTLITFDVFTQGKTPSDSSPFMTEAVGLTDMEDSQSWLTLQHKGDTDSLTRLVEVEKRVKDLYCQRLVGDSFVADTSRDTSSDNSLLPPSAPLTPRGDGEGDNSSTVSSAAGVAPPAGKLTSGNRSEKDNAKVRDNSRSSSDQGKPAGVKNVREGSRNIQNMRREAAGGQNGKTSSSSNSSKVKSKTDRSSSGSAGKASVEKKLSTGSNKTDVSVTSNVLAETDDNSSAVTKMSSAVSGSHTSGAVSQNDSGYAKTGSFSSTSSCAPDSTSLNNTLVADRSSDEGKGQDESVSNGHLPEPPSVYYLYRPDMEKDEPKRKDSGSDQSVAKTDSGQGLARGKNSTSRLMQEGRTKNKSEDSGVSSITDDNIPNAKEKKDNENAKKISSSSDRSSSNKHLPSDKLNGVQTSEQIKNMKNRLKNSGSSDPGDDFQKENNLECCINKGSRFYSNGDSDISSMSQTEDNAETAECEGNATTDVVLSDKEEAALGDSLKVDEKTSSPPADDQNVGVVVVPGQRSQTSQSLESNGRSVSEDSNKTCGSDDVFSEDTPIDTSLETPTQDGSHANPPPGHGRSSEFESPEKDVEDTSFSNSTTPCGGDVSVPNGHCVNGYLSDKHGSQEDDVVTTPVERAVAHRNSRRSTLANVRSLAAQFEAKVKDNSVESPSSSPTKLRSPTRPVGVPESLVAPRNGSLGKERTGVERPSSLPLAPNGHTKLRRVVSNPVGGRPRRFAGKSETFSQFYVELHKAPTRDTDVKEIGLKDCQAKLCSKSEMLSPEDSSRTTATTPSTVTETESVASNADIDTKFYGDSDEETCVHEARVQSFKNTYKKLSSVNAPKFRPQTEIIPENDAGSGKDLTPSIPEKQSVESTAPTPAADSIGGGDASITSDVTPQSSSTTPAPSSTVSSSTVSVLSRKRTFSSSSSGGDASRLLSRKDSDVSSIQDNNMQSRDPEAQWRLDYTNVHVDTDADSTAMSSVSEEAGEGTDEGEGHLTSATGRRLSGLSTSSDVKDQRLSQFLKDTAASFSTQFGHSLEEDSMSAFLNTPTMSCNSWSSYDEISTPPCADVTTNKHNGFPRSSVVSMGSRSTSIASTMDLLYSADLSLMSKNKIADKPVKWLLNTEYGGKPVVLSFCGSHSDDEAVLIWSREDDETLWTNCPVLEYNPITRTATLPRYMRPHLSSSSSTLGSPKQRPASVNSN